MPSPCRPEKTEHCGVLCCGDGVYIGNSLVPVRGTNREQRPLVPVGATNRDQWVPYIYPIATAEHSTVLCFFWPARGGHLGALAHLLCTWGVRWNVWATLVNLSPLQDRPPSSIFLNICLGLAVHHAPSPSSPPSITRADLIASTTVVSLLFLSSFWKEKYSYLYYFLTFIIASYIVRWFWYPPPSALVLSMIRMWYILSFYNYLVHLLFMTIMPTNVT